jgi:hypothetical protein
VNVRDVKPVSGPDEEVAAARLRDFTLIELPGETGLYLWHRPCQHTLGLLEPGDTVAGYVEAAVGHMHACPPDRARILNALAPPAAPAAGITAAGLALALLLDQSAVTAQCAVLEADGLVTSWTSAPGAAPLWTLTPAGRQAAKR